MIKKVPYEKPEAQVLCFQIEEELMTGGGDLEIISIPIGGGVGTPPFENNNELNDKSSYQID